MQIRLETKVSGRKKGDKRMIRSTRGEKVFDFVNILTMIFVLFIVVLPVLNVISNSLVSSEEILKSDFIIFPRKFDLSAYRLIFNAQSLLLNGFKITVFRVVAGTVLTIIVTYFLAYGLSKRNLIFRKQITFYIFFTMLFGGGIIPYYILVKNLRLTNSIWVYVIPGLVSAWYVLLMRNFIMQIPDALIEAAYIDGASELRILFIIILPLSLPAMATIALYIIVAHWNSWFDAFMFVIDEKKHPVQMVLRNIVVMASIPFDPRKMGPDIMQVKVPARSVQNAAVIVTTLPVVFTYPFLQKYFVKGLVLGSVKG